MSKHCSRSITLIIRHKVPAGKGRGREEEGSPEVLWQLHRDLNWWPGVIPMPGLGALFSRGGPHCARLLFYFSVVLVYLSPAAHLSLECSASLSDIPLLHPPSPTHLLRGTCLLPVTCCSLGYLTIS